MTKGQWKCYQRSLWILVSCAASAQVGVTESCLNDGTSLFVTGTFYPTEYIRILHLSLRATALLPLTSTCLVFLHGFLKRPVFPHLVISALVSGLHHVKYAFRLFVRDFLQESFFLNSLNHDKCSLSAFGNPPPV